VRHPVELAWRGGLGTEGDGGVFFGGWRIGGEAGGHLGSVLRCGRGGCGDGVADLRIDTVGHLDPHVRVDRL